MTNIRIAKLTAILFRVNRSLDIVSGSNIPDKEKHIKKLNNMRIKVEEELSRNWVNTEEIMNISFLSLSDINRIVEEGE